MKSIIRRLALSIISQPKAHVTVNLHQINYGGILANNNIVITGGSKGIGLAMAHKFVSEGANVLITGRNVKDLQNAVTELGANASYIVFDNLNASEIEKFWNLCLKRMGSVDSLVLNAGISFHEGNFLNVTQEGFDQQLNINLKANYFLAQTFLRYKLQKNESGNLLFMSSETAAKCIDIPYGLTKASINSLVGGLARRVYQKGIRVNAIAPGVTMTEMTGGNVVDKSSDLATNSVAGRWLLPNEIAEVACFILSNASKCITGEIIYCDAGSHLKVNGSETEYSII